MEYVHQRLPQTFCHHEGSLKSGHLPSNFIQRWTEVGEENITISATSFIQPYYQ